MLHSPTPCEFLLNLFQINVSALRLPSRPVITVRPTLKKHIKLLGDSENGTVPLRIMWHLCTGGHLSTDLSRSLLRSEMSVSLSENVNALWRVNRRLLLLSQYSTKLSLLCAVHKESNEVSRNFVLVLDLLPTK